MECLSLATQPDIDHEIYRFVLEILSKSSFHAWFAD